MQTNGVAPKSLSESAFLIERFSVEPAMNRVCRGAHVIHLEPKAMQLLVFMAEHSGEVLSRELLLNAVWGDAFVTDQVLSNTISNIRHAFGEDGKDYIETIPKRGYLLAVHPTPVQVNGAGKSGEQVQSEANADISPAAEIAGELKTDPLKRGSDFAHGLRQAGSNSLPLMPVPIKPRTNWKRLRIIAGLVLAAALASILGLNWNKWRERLPGHTVTPIRSIAVLPLANLSGDPQQEYFADGMTEELITELSKISALKVTSRTSVLSYKGGQRPLPEIARELKVDALVEGSVRRSGDRVRISAQLIRAATDQHIWGQSYDRDLRDVLSLHSEVAQAIAQEIQVNLTPAEQHRLGSVRPVIPESHEAYLRGRYQATRFTREPLLKARDYLQEAIDKDPTFAPAYAELAHVYLKLAIASGPERSVSSSPTAVEMLPRARAAAQRSLELDPTLAQTHMVVGLMRIYFDFQLPEGKQELERAATMAPDSADVLIHASLWRAIAGQTIEARAATEHALELDPVSIEVGTLAGQVFFRLRDYNRAIDHLQKTLEVEPNSARAYAMLCRVFEAKGMNAEAVAAYQRVIALNGGTPQEIAAPSVAFTSGGIRGFWVWRLQELDRANRKGFDSPTERARLYALLGDKNRALELLERAYQQRDYTVYATNVGYEFDGLRSDPRFQTLLRHLNFPQ